MQKYFPYKKNVDFNKLKMSANSSYSITKPEDAKQIENIINNYGNKLVILDGTANVGGDTINFGLNDNVFKIISVEKNEETFNNLINNIEVYGLKKKVYPLNADITKVLDICTSIPIDILFLDAPWGGPSYKYKNFLDLELSGIKLYNVIKKASKCGNIKNVIMKVPFNYNTKALLKETNLKKITIDKIESGKNYYLVICAKLF